MFYFYFTIIYSLWSFKYNFCTFFINVDWICNFVLPCLWNSRYHLHFVFWLRSLLSYVIMLPSIKFLCIVVCLFVVLLGVFPMLLSVFLRPMTFDNPSTPHPGQRFVIILKVSKNKKKSFPKNYSEIYGKNSRKSVKIYLWWPRKFLWGITN